MQKRDKQICIVLAVVLIMVMIWMIIMPVSSFATSTSSSSSSEASQTEKKTYEASSSASSTTESKASGAVGDIASEAANNTEMVKGYIDSMLDTADEILDTTEYKALAKDYKAPAWITKLTSFFALASVSISDWAARLYAAISTLLIINSIFAVESNTYYEYLSTKKLRFIMRSVDATRQKYSLGTSGTGGTNGGNVTTTTNTKDGTVTNTVSTVAKTVTGPGAMLVYLIFNSIVEIGVLIAIFLMIKIGFIGDALKGFIGLLGKALIALLSVKP